MESNSFFVYMDIVWVVASEYFVHSYMVSSIPIKFKYFFTQLYGFKYSYQIQIICTLLYGFNYS